jgi:hypothetical protein
MALLILAILFVVASSFLRLTLSEDQIAGGDRDRTLALNAAEAGVQQATQNIKAAATLTVLLGNPAQNQPPPTTFPNGESYSFRIDNDPAEFTTPAADTNGYVMITSTGRARNATRIIETVVCVPKLPPFPSALHMPGNEGDSNFSGTSFIVDGNDTDPTSETRTGAQTKLGVSTGSVGVRNTVYNALNSAERTTPVFAGSAGDYDGKPSLGVDTSLDSNAVQNMATQCGSLASALNTRNIGRGTLSVSGTHAYANGSGGGPNVDNNQAWGTPSNPGVFYIKGISEAEYGATPGGISGTVSISGDFEGAGVLILDGADLSISGNFRWEGVIIVTGPLVGMGLVGGGNQKIFGAVVVNERQSDRCAVRADCNELVLRGNPAIRYSQTAINRAAGALALRYVYWNERGL